VGLPPFRTAPLFKPKPWAGGRLMGLIDGFPAGTGEAWLVSDLPGDASPVLDGPFAGRTLREVVAEAPGELLGDHAGAGRFPLLVKLLDVGDPLSVQVHPDAAVAQARGDGERGKSEAWLVLEGGEERRVHLGLAAPTDPDEVLRLAESGELPGRLAGFRPTPGEGIEIAPGLLHTAQEVLVLEVQEPSDVTYRVFDWGRGRELHLEATRATLAALGGAAPARLGAGWRRGRWPLVERSPFAFDALDLRPGHVPEVECGEPRVLVVVEGRLVAESNGHPPLVIGRGEAAVCPASLSSLRLRALSWCRVATATPCPPPAAPC